ncbi:E3 ubiquitin-protein ligase At3g02290-like isoform X1 [Dioscorea cayenensis subsp. rotundata]|uniref:RING-type E3 ubiquitin transferase n=1 Tax=Dioscorea cayennensis subsp. rotundata TaxID=55577 RepID=A0AB40CAM8_DIOCR|nr:E3 ubiquitin-protein ligase At3g02290-like isoform X1 [Dioscorea cayenensis subsp. rotundata]XP_039136941.1 E3 ubiquitin-protein ligase At3g02290-like isoform X1 [Dioscorea cayenensis subsp. rotundata]
MGSLLCCFRVADVGEGAENSDSLVSRHCICLRCLTQQLSHAQYIALFQRGEVHAAASASVRQLPSLASVMAAEDSSLPNTYRSPPRPLPYDDPRCSRPRDRLVSRREKCSSHSHEESEPLRRDFDENNAETKAEKDKRSGSKNGVKLCCSNSSTDVTSGSTYYFSSSEDEDVCPTCLEEYTSENPKIVMQCSHHFHLSCIYEWMERSEICPVCGKVMVFNEAR